MGAVKTIRKFQGVPNVSGRAGRVPGKYGGTWRIMKILHLEDSDKDATFRRSLGDDGRTHTEDPMIHASTHIRIATSRRMLTTPAFGRGPWHHV
jgi:hypothetical protein